ncbi:hypothetical protein NLG97_g8624 [Lecanicillium saksenae]|uniref:Uncharacterized protein n=1 Tax=Lecanicillium saksenae TaxID=468837 RepID=A0ACC1QIB8_9HYPO|nr:hypothetical protein NLG97_g8624 [Lecanicillium saksenae]
MGPPRAKFQWSRSLPNLPQTALRARFSVFSGRPSAVLVPLSLGEPLTREPKPTITEKYSWATFLESSRRYAEPPYRLLVATARGATDRTQSYRHPGRLPQPVLYHARYQHQLFHPKAAAVQRPSSVLYCSTDSATVIVDIPRSLEESQLLPGEQQNAKCRIYSSVAPTVPFETPEPANGPGSDVTASPALQIATLMTAETLRSKLEALSQDYTGSYCLSRKIVSESSPPPLPTEDSTPYIPPNAEYLHGSIHDMKHAFSQSAPKFNLIVMDPPWPNRSVRRKTARYKTASSLSGIRELLCGIPVSSHLSDDGLVAIWITNKPRIVDLLSAPGGIFEEWGLEVVAEWTWLKVTATGEPLFPLDSAWRKPWEKLLVAKRIRSTTPEGLAPKTIIAVPDIHSRKPNLRGLFQDVLGASFCGLEVFARGLTAGWWSWGDEVVKFQQPQHWHTMQNQ